MSRIRIVVADQAEAIFYDTPSLQAPPREVAHISDPLAHQHDRDFSSDRPGRRAERVIRRRGRPRHRMVRSGR